MHPHLLLLEFEEKVIHNYTATLINIRLGESINTFPTSFHSKLQTDSFIINKEAAVVGGQKPPFTTCWINSIAIVRCKTRETFFYLKLWSNATGKKHLQSGMDTATPSPRSISSHDVQTGDYAYIEIYTKEVCWI